MTGLRALGLTVERGGRCILDGVDLALLPGELVAIIGANGAGKSTLVGALAGDFPASSGQVLLDGRPLGDWPLRETARRRAVLRQAHGVAFGFSARQVALLGRTPHGAGWAVAPADVAIADAALAEADALHLADRVFSTLSGGEQQRVHLARALAQVWDEQPEGPGYLLLDEPTAGLDLPHQHHALVVARRRATSGLGVLAVLHDITLAARFADRAVVLHRGVIVSDGPPRTALTSSAAMAALGIEITLLGLPTGGELLVPIPPPNAMAALYPTQELAT